MPAIPLEKIVQVGWNLTPLEETSSNLSAPTGVSASDGTSTDSKDGVFITWNSVSGANYYRVYRANSKTGPKTAVTNWQSARWDYDFSVTPGTIYFYFVKAATSISGANASDYSNYDEGHVADEVPVLNYIQASPSSIILKELEYFQFPLKYTIKAYFSDGDTETWTDYRKFSFKTSDEYIAYVDSEGVYGDVMGIGAGTATITITYREDTSKKAYLTVTVYE